jgi:hypothetical protein
MEQKSGHRRRRRAASVIRAEALVAVLVLAACSSDPDPDLSMYLAPPPLRLDPVFTAAEAYCSVEACHGGDPDGCRYFVPFDVLVTAQLAPEPQRCLDAFVAQIECETADGCAGTCTDERATTETRCASSMDPSVPEPFDGARALCEARVFCDVVPGDPALEFDVAECQAEQGARLWVEDRLGDPGCTCELQDLLGCLATVELSCDPGPAEENAACPDQSGALSLCETGTQCVRLDSSTSPTACEAAVSCDATIYEASCMGGECSCTVGGAPGAVLGATDCEDALRECGAPL